MGFSRQAFWSRLPFPPPGDLPAPGVKPASLAYPALTGTSFTTEPPGKPLLLLCVGMAGSVCPQAICDKSPVNFILKALGMDLEPSLECFIFGDFALFLETLREWIGLKYKLSKQLGGLVLGTSRPQSWDLQEYVFNCECLSLKVINAPEDFFLFYKPTGSIASVLTVEIYINMEPICVYENHLNLG